MKVLDANGKEISKGLQVKYRRTHTTGKVDKIIIKGGVVWIRLDSSGLYYRSDYIETFKDKIPLLTSYESKNKGLKSNVFKTRKPVLISDPEDGPGYGGG